MISLCVVMYLLAGVVVTIIAVANSTDAKLQIPGFNHAEMFYLVVAFVMVVVSWPIVILCALFLPKNGGPDGKR